MNSIPSEDKILNKPVKCPDCGFMTIPQFMTEHGCCEVCADKRAEKFTAKFLDSLEVNQITASL
jgi:hypothetical protein